MAPAWVAGDRKACTSPSGGACAGLLDEKFERGLPVQRVRLDELLGVAKSVSTARLGE